MKKPEYKGDGLKFFEACVSLKKEDIMDAMGIKSTNTFYGLYKKEKFTQEYKESAANALGKTVQEIFGDASNNLNISLSQPKEVIPVGKHQATGRLKPDEYAAAYKGWLGVPMYNAPVTASFVETYRDESVYQPAYYLHDPRFKDCKFGAIITGDSMHSEIRHGDHVVCQEILDWSFVVFGDIYYIVSTNGLETCKYLNADPADKNNFLLVPRNEAISPSPLPKGMILRMYKVRGIIRGY